MIKEELRKEIEKEAKRRTKGFRNQENCIQSYIMGASDFAEPREKRIAELEEQIEKMKKYIKACWVEENLNDYSSYITNSSDEFRDLVKELNEEIRNGR
jgi:hypothetical protein